MSQWIKLHTEIINDPKMARLNWKDRGIWMMLMALAGQLEHRDENDRLTGQLDTLDHVAWHLRTRVANIRPTVEKLIQLDMLHQDDDGILYVTHFAERQSADTSTERVRRYRERGRLHHPDETSVKRDETPMKRGETEQNRAESEQNQNRTRTRATDQNRADLEHSAVVAVDKSLDKSVETVDNGVDRPVGTVVDAAVEGRDDSATDDEEGAVPEGEVLPEGGVDGDEGAAEPVRAAICRVAATRDANRAQARAQLVALGVDAAMAERLAREHPPERIQGWCAYARRQSSLSNPAGFVVNRLVQGLSPPEGAGETKRWYTEEEYARFFVHGG